VCRPEMVTENAARARMAVGCAAEGTVGARNVAAAQTRYAVYVHHGMSRRKMSVGEVGAGGGMPRLQEGVVEQGSVEAGRAEGRCGGR